MANSISKHFLVHDRGDIFHQLFFSLLCTLSKFNLLIDLLLLRYNRHFEPIKLSLVLIFGLFKPFLSVLKVELVAFIVVFERLDLFFQN